VNTEGELQRQTRRAQVAEGLVAALTDAAMRVSAHLQAELKRPAWEQKTGKEGLETALTLLRAHLGPLVNGPEAVRYREVLRCARTLARAMGTLEGK
jgi:hypothetical protein